ncbi:hypothetical protein NST83_04245 [Paenibacillus sp. FSL R10-2782]|uniref:hypothetical protein n=1 Tax=Paenibacillus sp. FSL R10-2782 TaxID=2954661 RepID=UPI003159000C
MDRVAPSRTINQLHFEDLDPIRFEELILSIAYRTNRWLEINHFGKKGSDDGIDIEAIEELDAGVHRRWYFQCKRYKKITLKQLKDIVDDVIVNKLGKPDILVIAVSCAVRKATIESFKEYAATKGIGHASIWTSTVIEAKLYAEYHDLLFSYFGISLSSERRNRIATVRRNISLKEKMKKDFLKRVAEMSEDVWERIKHPYKKFKSSEILIRSVDDTFYPENIPDELGNYPWYKVESYDFYHNGIRVIIGIRELFIDRENNWGIIKNHSEKTYDQYHRVKAFEIGNIPFSNIIEYDINGDEFFIYPHLFCDFSNQGHPYESIDYVVENKDGGHVFLDRSRRILI